MTEKKFVSIYGDVQAGPADSDVRVPLTTLLQMEADFCPVEGTSDMDPRTRLSFLAQCVGDSLLPEHRNLIITKETTGQ